VSLIKTATDARIFKALKQAGGNTRRILEGAENAIATSMPVGRGERAVAGHYVPVVHGLENKVQGLTGQLSDKTKQMQAVVDDRQRLMATYGKKLKDSRSSVSEAHALRRAQVEGLSGAHSAQIGSLNQAHSNETSVLKSRLNAADGLVSNLAKSNKGLGASLEESGELRKAQMEMAQRSIRNRDYAIGGAAVGGLGIGAVVAHSSSKRKAA